MSVELYHDPRSLVITQLVPRGDPNFEWEDKFGSIAIYFYHKSAITAQSATE